MCKQVVSVPDTHEVATYANIFFGLGITNKMNDLIAGLKGRGIDDLLVVTGPEVSEAWPLVAAALDEHNITWELHKQVMLNPTIKQSDIATAVENVDSKHTAVLLKHLDKGINSLYELKFICTCETL